MKRKLNTPPIKSAVGASKTNVAGTFGSDDALEDSALDRFKRKAFAERVAQTIIQRKHSSSMVVGLYGSWGEGKTTVLNFVENILAKDPSGVTYLRFNPWRFGTEDRLLSEFFNQLANALGKSLTTNGQTIGNAIRALGELMPSEYGLSILGGMLRIGGKKLADKSVEDERRRINQLLEQEKRPIVIVMDDIDRLDTNEVHVVFKLVKLVADFPYTTYVLAFDPDRVAEAVGVKYGDGSSAAGYAFLDKIVQVPLNLPRADPLELRKFLMDCVQEAVRDSGAVLSEAEFGEFREGFILGLEQQLLTPRVAKRYSNAIAFALPLLNGEVHPSDLMLLEGIRLLYPRVYSAIRDKFGDAYFAPPFRERTTSGLKAISMSMSDISADEAKAVSALISFLFPSGQDDESASDGMRISSPHHFARYFSYAILEGDISDQIVNQLVAKAASVTQDELVDAIRSAVPHGSEPRFVFKLQRRLLTIEPSAAARIATAIARCGDLFRDETNRAQPMTGELLRSLIELAPDGQRADTGLAVLAANSNPLLGLYALAFLSKSRTMTKQEVAILSTAVKKRSIELLAGRLIYAPNPQRTGLVFQAWRAYGGDVATYTSSALRDHPEDVHILLGTYFRYPAVVVAGDQYAEMTKYVNGQDVEKALMTTFGNVKYQAIANDKTPLFARFEDQSAEEVARRFVTAYQLAGGPSVQVANTQITAP